jgi:hypothetical protein
VFDGRSWAGQAANLRRHVACVIAHEGRIERPRQIDDEVVLGLEGDRIRPFAQRGVNIRYVQRLLGHPSIVTTEIYTHVADAALKSRVIERHLRKSILGRT